ATGRAQLLEHLHTLALIIVVPRYGGSDLTVRWVFRVQIGVTYGRQTKLKGVDHLLPIQGGQQRTSELQVADDRGRRVEQLWISHDPVVQPQVHVTVCPLIADLRRLLQRDATAHRQIDGSGQDTGRERSGV